jgi:hypothetical protein
MVCAYDAVPALMRLVAHARLASLHLHVNKFNKSVLPVVSRTLTRQRERQRMHQQPALDDAPPLRDLEIKFQYDTVHLALKDVVALGQLSSRLTALAIGPMASGMCPVAIWKFGDSDLAALLAPLPLLQHLELWVNSSLSSGALRLVGERCALLESLALKGCYDLGALNGDLNRVGDDHYIEVGNELEERRAAMSKIPRRPLFPCLTTLVATIFEPREPHVVDDNADFEYEPPYPTTLPLLVGFFLAILCVSAF